MFNDKILKSVAEAVKEVLQQEALKGQQHKIDKNKNNKIDAHDFKILRGEKAPMKEGNNPFDVKNYKSQLPTKPGEKAGFDSKKISTGTVYSRKPVKDDKPMKEEASNDEFHAEAEKARKKSLGQEKAEVAKPAVSAVKQESVEQIDEALPDIYSIKNTKTGQLYHNSKFPITQNTSIYKKIKAKGGEHVHAAIHKNGKPIKEEVEQIEEREMTEPEMKKREKIVKSMKKGMQGFKDRYGDRAKNVMYATATKQAMKD